MAHSQIQTTVATSAGIHSYRDLKIWEEGMVIAELCCRSTRRFPKDEVTQIRRAAAAIPANIAEGHGRETRGEFIQFLRISQGSLKELETHVLLCQRVGLYGSEDVGPILERCETLGKMLRALTRSLQAKGKVQ